MAGTDSTFCSVIAYLSGKGPGVCRSEDRPMQSPAVADHYGEGPTDRAIGIASTLSNVGEEDAEALPTEEARLQARYGYYFAAGERITGGHGFWQSLNLFDHPNPKEMVRAFVDALKGKGWRDVDVVIYGDSSGGRHIADEITQATTYDEFRAVVERRSPDRPPR